MFRALKAKYGCLGYKGLSICCGAAAKQCAGLGQGPLYMKQEGSRSTQNQRGGGGKREHRRHARFFVPISLQHPAAWPRQGAVPGYYHIHWIAFP